MKKTQTKDGRLARPDARRIRNDLVAARDRLFERAGLHPGYVNAKEIERSPVR